MSDVTINSTSSNLAAAKKAVYAACKRALKECGVRAKKYARATVPVDTRALKKSIDYKLDGDRTMILYATEKYAHFVEFGTGIYATRWSGRQTPWVYYNSSWGQFVTTRGGHPQPYITPAMMHIDEWKHVFLDELRKL